MYCGMWDASCSRATVSGRILGRLGFNQELPGSADLLDSAASPSQRHLTLRNNNNGQIVGSYSNGSTTLGSMLDGAVYYSFGYPGGELGLKSYQTTSTMRPRWSGVLKFTLQLDAVFEYGRSQLSKRANYFIALTRTPRRDL